MPSQFSRFPAIPQVPETATPALKEYLKALNETLKILTGGFKPSEALWDWVDIVSFYNGWSNHSGDSGGKYNQAGYCKHPDGTVYLRGVITGGTLGNAVPAFYLPPTARPPRRLVFSPSKASTLIMIYPDGVVAVADAGSGTSNGYLDGIMFTTN